MKNMLNSIMIKRVVSSANEDGSFVTGKSNVKEVEFHNAVKYLRTLGFNVIDKKTDIDNNVRLSIIIDETATKTIQMSPYEFVMNRKALMNLSDRVNYIGFSMSVIIRAYADAIDEFTEDTIIRLRNYNLEDVIDYIGDILSNNGVHLDRKKINPRLFKDIVRYIGGYKGLKGIICDAISAIADDDQNIPNVDSQCYTCKFCKFDDLGNRYCDRAQFRLPDDMKVSEVTELYPEVEIYEGVMLSKYTPFGMKGCKVFERRRMPR